MTLSFCLSVHLSVRLFVCSLKRVLVGHRPDWPSSAIMMAAISGQSVARLVRPVSDILTVARAYRVDLPGCTD